MLPNLLCEYRIQRVGVGIGKPITPGEYLRVAVPDGFHPAPDYIEWVRPGGNGPGADGHKVLFTSVGVDVSMREYYDEQGIFHYVDWDPAEGMIRRSKRFDKVTIDRSASSVDFDFTSLILDARKQNNLKP